MEALVAVGLASNVVQFVDFVTRLVSKVSELRKDAASSDHKDFAVIAAHLREIAKDVSASAQSIVQVSTTASLEEKALLPVADGCCDLAKKLLKRLDDLGLLSPQTENFFRRGKMAWRWIWNKKEIEEIACRLHYFGSQLAIHMTYQVRQAQQDQKTWQSSKDDTQAVLDKISGILPLIENLKLDVHDKLDRHHADLLNSLADLSTHNSQLQLRATQEASSTVQVVSERIGDLETSVGAMMLENKEGMKTYHSDILESLATVQSQNSEFRAVATQVLSQTCNFDTASFQNVMRLILDEYQEKFLSEVRKEFRGTARAEMESLQSQAFQALDRMQNDLQAADSETEKSPYPMMESHPRSGKEINAHEVPLEQQDHYRQQKINVAIAFRKTWPIHTRLGIMWLNIQDKAVFDPVNSPISVYELTVQFIPSPCWFSKSFSVAYSKTTDGRGSPRFGLQFETYRVLNQDHMVWKTIENNDIGSFRSMLSNKTILPSDRYIDGSTLLRISTALSEWMSICQQAGLDFDVPGESIFLEKVVSAFSLWRDTIPRQFHRCCVSVGMCSTISSEIPVHYAAFLLVGRLNLASRSSRVANSPTVILSEQYHKYYLECKLAESLYFLEHVIEMGIAQRVDCIFDSRNGLTISDLFRLCHLEDVWVDILEGNGFDSHWVIYEEDQRRKRVVTGETSAHEITLGVDMTEALEVKRRRGYANIEE
ncbi:hypothetical protein F4677DRAFT_452350 [Hypoxylon crocopeplum]|nr:hypothetical protein F4677DRAFT_452350 [Hypoxylon crocopeplum]